MPNVVRFTLSTARELDVPGAGMFHQGVLDVDVNDLRLVARTRYKVQAYGAVEVGVVDSATPFPLLPAAPTEPTPDPYPQYLTEVEVGEEYVRWDQIDPAEPLIGTAALSTNTVVRRDGNGYFETETIALGSQPASANHAARRDYVDGVGTPIATPNTIARRSADGYVAFQRAYVESSAPVDAHELTRRDYVDGIGTPAATGSTVVRRSVGGNFDANIIYLTGTPTVPEHAAPKGYVDGRGRSPINGSIGTNYTPALTDEHRTMWFDVTAGSRTLTLPTHAAAPFADGSWFDVVNATGTNSVVIASGAGGTLQHAPGDEVLAGQFAHARLIKISAEQWYLVRLGDVIGTDTNTANTVMRRRSDSSVDVSAIYFSDPQPAAAWSGARRDFVETRTRRISEDIGSSRALVLADEGKWLYSSGVVTLTIPPDSSVAFAKGSIIEVNQLSGTLTIAAGAGVTIVTGVSLTNPGQYKTYRLLNINPNTWHVALWS